MSRSEGKNMVNAIIRLGGKRLNFVHLRIEQVYGDHHHFRLQLNYDVAGITCMHEPTEQMNYLGRFWN